MSHCRIAALLALFLTSGVGRVDAIVITEIMYNPPFADEQAAGGLNLEWVEIYNEDPTVFHLSGSFFSNGISFVFPDDVYLEGRSYLVVCANEQAVRSKYGITNTIGNFGLNLDNGGETLELSIFGGGPICRVRYRDRNRWPQAADGTGHSLALKDPYEDPDDPSNWTQSLVLGGTPGGPNFDEPTIIDSVLIDRNETWAYLKGTAPYPNGWTNVGFDDSGWARGQTGIGYGDGDDATELTDMQNGYLSFAARKAFELTVTEIQEITELILEVSYDDGFVAYLNGTEVTRSFLGTPGTPVAYNATAQLHEASGLEPFAIAKGLLVAGTNVLAVQVNNASLGSSDSSFIPRLVNRRVILPTPTGDPVPVVINECFSRTAGTRWLELYNPSGAPVDLAGFHLSDDRNELDRYTIPPGTIIAARAFASFTEAATGLAFTGPELTFYLTRPDLSEVIDAEVFENPPLADPPLEGTSDVRFPDGSGDLAVSHTPTRDAPNLITVETNVVINEILYNPPAGREGLEFFELYNRGSVAVDLSGCRIDKGVDYAFPDGTFIAAGDFLVVAGDPGAVESAHGIGGVLGPYTGVLSNRGDRLRLVDAFGNVMDEVNYVDGGRWSRWADGGGSSLELLDADQDNSVASAWEASDESSKSQWEEVDFVISGYPQQAESEFQVRLLGAGEVLIDTISLQRSGVEYVSNGDFESSTSPWRIEGNHIQSSRTTEDRYTGSACLKIVATGDGDTRVNRIEQDTPRTMSSGSYTGSCAVRWLRGANLIFFSGFNQTPQFQIPFWLTYPENLGTPGRRNSRAVDNLGPVISDVRHEPAVPSASAAVTIRARVSDSDGVQTVRARYRLGTSTGTYSSATLYDDGAHDDEDALDGVFGGTIPGQALNTKVVYYVEAEDELGAVRRFPVEAPGRTLVYQHASLISSNSFQVRLIHDDTTLSELTSRQLHSNEMLDATFIFNESKVYYSTGTRFRGSPWNRPPSPRMYRVRFGKDDLYRGRRAVNLSRYGNNQREHAAYYSVWRNSTPGTASPMSRGAFARVNTYQGTSSMELVDPVNSDYLDLWFPGDAEGILMKITGKLIFNDGGSMDNVSWATWSNRGTNKGNYRWNFNFRTRELEDDFSPLMSLVATMASSTSSLDTQLEGIMDVEQFLRVYAARCAHDDWDTISIGNGQNAYCYYAPLEGRWKLLPWDMDHSWGNPSARIYPDADGAFNRVITRPKFRRMYQGILNEMINGRGQSPGFWSASEMVAKVLDPTTDAVGSNGVENASAIRNFINSRRGQLAGQIPARIPFAIVTNSGEDFSVDDTTVSLSGNAWIDVFHIVANGQAVEASWSSTTRWSGDVELDFGANELTLLAFDSTGSLVGSDTIAVTSTAGWVAPTVSEIEPPQARPGDSITISGSNFHDGIVVLFDGVPATDVIFSETTDPTTVAAIVPVIEPGDTAVTVRNVDGRLSEPMSWTALPEPPKFIRGDANLDRFVEVGDALRVLAWMFRGVPSTCFDAGDFDDNEALELTDSLGILNLIFLNGTPPPAPYPEAGVDPDDAGPLGCDEGV